MAYRARWLKLWLVLLAVIACLPGRWLGADENDQGNKPPVTVRDCIRMTRLADPVYGSGGSARGRVAQFSPDGRQFLVVLRKGNLEQNTDEYSLLLFRTDQILNSAKPQVLLTLASSSNRPAISGVKWLDNKTIAFLGEKPGGVPQVYTLNTGTLHLRRLTDHPTTIISFDLTADGKELVFEADPPRKKALEAEETERRGMVITTQPPEEILAGDSWSFQATVFEGEELFIKRGRDFARRILVRDVLLNNLPPPSLSPDGRHAIVYVWIREIPHHWEKYQDALLHERVTEKRMPGAASGVFAPMLLDTSTGDLGLLLEAPPTLSHISSYGFAWAPDGQSLVLSGALLPLDVTDPSELDSRLKTRYVIELKLPNREIMKITDKDLKVIRWDLTRNMIVLESSDRSKTLASAIYRKRGPRWEEVAVKPEDITGDVPIEVTLDEDINTPPRIFAIDPKSKRRGLLLDLNPQFAGLRFSKVEAVSWKATDGHEVLGGLYLPPDYVAGAKYPLVMQTHGFKPSRFMIDGPWGGGAFSAQPLANKGFVVLQVGGSKDPAQDRTFIDTTQEAPREMAAYEGAIDYLDGRGLIDAKLVGIIGFSRTEYSVKYALTHSKYRFAAATVADGIDAGYFSYMVFPNKGYENLNGGPPFGEALQLWLKNSPGFNLDKVRTPVRIEAYSPFSLLGLQWEWFSGLTYLRKPVDFLYLRDGTHLLVRPWQRLASQQGNVDWFSFWLKGEEDADPAKAEQYARWRELRKLQEKQVTGDR